MDLQQNEDLCQDALDYELSLISDIDLILHYNVKKGSLTAIIDARYSG